MLKFLPFQGQHVLVCLDTYTMYYYYYYYYVLCLQYNVHTEGSVRTGEARSAAAQTRLGHVEQDVIGRIIPRNIVSLNKWLKIKWFLLKYSIMR